MADGDTPAAVEQQANIGLVYTALGSFRDWRAYVRSMSSTFSERHTYERSLIREGEFVVHGHCYPCRRSVPFSVDYRYSYPIDGLLTPNWRERINCPECGLNSRMRGTLHLLETVLEPARNAAILIAERVTPVYQWLAAGYDSVTGFEYLGTAIPAGQVNAQGVRNESLTALTFEAGTFDYVLAFDVLEHIPDYRSALRECARVLRPGGGLALSVPFVLDSPEHLIRAKVTNTGEIEHLLPPDYHGDPLNQQGCLAFYDYGWQLLADLADAGFSSALLYHFWSQRFCYLGMNQCLIIASR